MFYVAATFAVLVTMLGAALALVLAGSAILSLGNAPPVQRPWLWAMFATSVAVGLASLGGAIVLLIHNRPLVAAAVGAIPVALFVGVYVYETLRP